MTTNSRPWQSFTIFISSTFTDMDAERDYLNNIIARDLEREFEKRRVSLTFVDLRWGVHTDKEKRQDERELSVLNVCMEEIKRSRPFFVALLGHRYGWVPSQECFQRILNQMDDEDRSLLQGAEGYSVTAMEILFGALGRKDLLPHSLFYFRDKESYDNMPAEKLPQYIDPVNSDKLEHLKQHIRSRCEAERLDNVHTYRLEWKDDRFTRLEEWGEQLKRQLRHEIETELADTANTAPQTWIEAEELQQEIFRHTQTRLFVGRQKELDTLEHFALTRQGVIVIPSYPLMGKSALLCQLYTRLVKRPEFIVLLHCTKVSLYADYTYRMFCRFASRLCTELNIPYAEPDKVGNKARLYFLDLVHQATVNKRKVILLIDSTDAFRPSDDASNYSWLPDEACCILTCKKTAEEGYEKEITIYKPEAQVMSLSFLTRQEALLLLQEQCRLYHKSIPDSLIDLILSKKYTGDKPLEWSPDEYYAYYNPLWIKLLVWYLVSLDEADYAKARYTGSETDNEKRLENYLLQCVQETPVFPSHLVIQSIIPRLLHDVDKNFLWNILFLLAFSYRGLSETDLKVLLGPSWNPLAFSNIHHYLKDILVQDYESGTWYFTYQHISQMLSKLPSQRTKQALFFNLSLYYLGPGKNRPHASQKEVYYCLMADLPLTAAYTCIDPDLSNENLETTVTEITENIKSDDQTMLPWVINMFCLSRDQAHQYNRERVNNNDFWEMMESYGYTRLYQIAIEYLYPQLNWWRKEIALQFAQGIENSVKAYADRHPENSDAWKLLKELYYKILDSAEAMGDFQTTKKYAQLIDSLEADKKEIPDSIGVQIKGRAAMNEKDYALAEKLFTRSYLKDKQNYQASPHDIQLAYNIFSSCLHLLDLYRRTSNRDKQRKLIEEAQTYIPQISDRSEFLDSIAAFCQMAGQAYVDMEDCKKALPFLTQAIEMRTALHEQNLQNDHYTIELGIAYETLGTYYENRNENDRALTCYQKQFDLFQKVLIADPQNMECRHFLLIAACHLWDIHKEESDESDERWEELNNTLIQLGITTDATILESYELQHVGQAYFFLYQIWEKQSPEEQLYTPQDMFTALLDGWALLEKSFIQTQIPRFIVLGLFCLYYRLEIAVKYGFDQKEVLELLINSYYTYQSPEVSADIPLGQTIVTRIERVLSMLQKKKATPLQSLFSSAYEKGDYAEAIARYDEIQNPSVHEQMVYALCLLRANLKKKAELIFNDIRQQATERDVRLLATLNLGTCLLLNGKMDEFQTLFKELTEVEKQREQAQLLLHAYRLYASSLEDNRPWYKRWLGSRPTTNRPPLSLPKPYGWEKI